MVTRAIPLLMVLMLGGSWTLSGAAEPQVCDQVRWPAAVLDQFPDADKACRDIVVRDGVRYVKFTARYVRTDAEGNVYVRVRLPDGSTAPRAFKAPQYLDVKSESGLSAYHFRELEKGEVLDVYIPMDSVLTAGAAAASVDQY